jgi:hypothetical protein
MAHNGKFKGKYTKEKTVQKEFTVNSDAALEVLNRYGNISVTTWNENRTVIDIVIRTNGNNESKVQERLDDISIDITGNLSRVTANTNFGKENKGWSWNSKSKNNIAVEVNYTIKIPNTNTVNLTNKYGAINVGDLQGNVVINHKYGQLTIGELQAENNSITMKYVKTASIKYMKSGKINAGYSTFSLDGSERLLLEASYTTSNLGKMGDLTYENKYGKLRVESATNVEGDAGYNNGTFGNISGAASFNVKYSTISIELLTATAKDVTFNGKYSSFNLGIHNDYAFNFDMNLSYGSLKGKDKLSFTTRNTKNSTGEYKGYHNSENSGNNININSSYGSVTIK